MKSFFETGFKLKTYIKLSVKSILAYLGVNKNGIAEQTYDLSSPLYVWCKMCVQLSRANYWSVVYFHLLFFFWLL